MKMTVAALMLTLATTVQSDDMAHAKCKQISDSGYNIMRAHQWGLSMSERMESFKEFEVAQSMIKMAYSEPRHSTKELQERAQAEFRDRIYLLCIEGESVGETQDY